MPPQLVAVGDGTNILLDKPILLIGRHQECDIQIPSRKISRRHCCIAQVTDHLVVRDLGSTNGIRVNGVRVAEGMLRTGDELIIGNFKYQVRLNSAGAEAPAAPPEQPQAASLPSPFDSCEDPVPIDETGKPAKPPAKQHELFRNLEDIPLAIFPESMSLKPMSDDASGAGR